MEKEDFLTKEEKQKIVEELSGSDIRGLKTLESYIYARAERYTMTEDLTDLISDVISLNGMVAMGETFSGVYSKHYDEIFEVYYALKIELLELCGITEEYWEEV